MRRILAPAFLTTVSLAAGCTKKPVDDGNTHNPPPIHLDDAGPNTTPTRTHNPPAIVDSGAPKPEPTTATDKPTKKRKRTAAANYEPSNEPRPSSIKMINPRDGNGRIIMAMADDRCAVEVPFKGPMPTNMPTGYSPRSYDYVDCPSEMDDPAWDHCATGMSVDTASLNCFCMASGGNPPPPPRKVKCPANAKELAKKP